MINKLKILYSKLDVHTAEVLRKSAASTVVKVVGMAIGLVVSVFLGRTIGADGLGIINLSNRIVGILIIVGLLGMRQVIIKEVAISFQKKDFQNIGDVMHTSYWFNSGITLSMSLLLILLAPFLANNIFHEPRLTYPLIIAFAVMTPQVFSRIFSSGMIGYKKIWQSNLVDQTLSMVITAGCLLILWLIEYQITVVVVALCYAMGRVITTISMFFYWKKLYNFNYPKRWIAARLIKTSNSIFILELSVVISTNVGVLLIGSLINSKEVGLYTVANRLALLTSFFLQVTNSVIAPKIASLFEQNHKDDLKNMLQKTTLGLSIIGLITLIIFIFAGKQILSLWGSEFINGYSLLIIMGIGQFINLSTGAVGLLLTMTGFEKTHRNISILVMTISIPLSYFLILIWGALGAAILFASIRALENIIKLIYANKKTGINIIPIIKIN